MKNIYIPEKVEDYQSDFAERVLPDESLRTNDFYSRMAGWVMDNRTPIIYEQDHCDEYRNFSINYNWLLLRDYSKTPLGDPAKIATMYALHELSHMTHRLPTRLSDLSAAEYAEDFTNSEYRASNETEILIHYRMPELREYVFKGMDIAVDSMKRKGVPQLSMRELNLLRSIMIETTYLDGWFGQDWEARSIEGRFKSFSGNRRWAKERFNAIQHMFMSADLPQSSGLTDDEYDTLLPHYVPNLSQDAYEENIIRNVRFGFAMTGQALPELETITDAIEASRDLEGRHARTQF